MAHTKGLSVTSIGSKKIVGNINYSVYIQFSFRIPLSVERVEELVVPHLKAVTDE